MRAGIVQHPEEYPYSSYRYYSKGDTNDLVTDDFVYEELIGSLQTKQLKYANMIIDDVIESTYTKGVWGTSEQRYNETRKRKYHAV